MRNTSQTFHPRRTGILIAALGIGLLVLASASLTQPAAASSAPDAAQELNDAACLGCHNKPGFMLPLPSGETLSLSIETTAFEASVHGMEAIGCSSCHTDITAFPHPALIAENLRDVATKMYTTCQQCHSEQYDQTLDSVHQRALAGGNSNAAVCTDCHNPHTQTRITDPDSGQILPDARLHIPATCARCHSAIYEQYKGSIHGSALTEENNLDVPTCIDCHGVHNISSPTTTTFRTNSPLICARCHTDPAIMGKYGISTKVVNTYVADFHGTTITLFEKTHPDQETNKPVCFDCHGVHNIQKTDDPVYGIAMKENLLVACQKCHPDATVNFPDSWMSHYIPSAEKYPIVYYVNLFYKFFIPAVLGPMVIFVLSDIARRLINRRKGAAHS